MLRRCDRRFALFALASVLALALCSLAVSPGTAADEHALDTATFRLELPRGWRKEGQGTPLRLRGPNSELMAITVAMPNPGGADTTVGKSKEVEAFWRDGIRVALTKGVTQKEGMKIVEALAERRLQAMPYFTAKAQDERRGIFLSGYGLIGRGGVAFLVTVEGRLKDKPSAEAAVESMLKRVVWKRKTSPGHSGTNFKATPLMQ